MTTWGAWSGHMRLGIDVWCDPINANTTSVNVYVQLHAQCDSSWNFADNQRVELSGSATAAWAWYNNLRANGVYTFPVVTIPNQGLSLGGGPGYYFAATLTGNYLGGTSNLAITWALPPRAIAPPAPPSYAPVARLITPTSIQWQWGSTSNDGGSVPDVDELHVCADAAFTLYAHVSTRGGNLRIADALVPDTQYWARSRIHNAAGWSGWVTGGPVRTAPFTPLAPTVSAITAVSATVSWPAPSGATPAQYELQIATNATFTTGVQTIQTSPSLRSRMITGLTPSTSYWVRVRASTSTGWGRWSQARELRTMSGAKVRVAGKWVDAIPKVRVDGKWRAVMVRKGISGQWRD